MQYVVEATSIITHAVDYQSFVCFTFDLKVCIVNCSAARLPRRVAFKLANHTKQRWADLRMRGDSAPDLSDLQAKVEQVLLVLQGKVDETFEEFAASIQQQYQGEPVAAAILHYASKALQ